MSDKQDQGQGDAKKYSVLRKEEVAGLVAGSLIVDYGYISGFLITDFNVVNGPEKQPIRENPEFFKAEYVSDEGSGTITRSLEDVVEIVKGVQEVYNVKLEPIINSRSAFDGEKGIRVEFFDGFRVIEPD